MVTGLLTIIRKNKAKSKEMRVLFLYGFLSLPSVIPSHLYFLSWAPLTTQWAR
jgi:hypothetical protein